MPYEILEKAGDFTIEIARLRAENAAKDARIAELEALISEPVEAFGTPALIAWTDRLRELLAEWEKEGGSLGLSMTIGSHLERFTKAWNSPTIAALRRLADDQQAEADVLLKRIAELEAALRKIREESRTWGWDFSPDEIEEIIASVDDAGDPGS